MSSEFEQSPSQSSAFRGLDGLHGEVRDSSQVGKVAPSAIEIQVSLTGEKRGPVESGEDFDLMESMESFSPLTVGEVVKGTVLKIAKSEAIVDVRGRSEGSIPLGELCLEDGSVCVEVGTEIDVLIERYNQKEGTVKISYRKVQQQRVWEDIEVSFREKTAMKGRVIERIKGGLVVDIGVRAFLPGSQVEVRPVRNFDALMGQEIDCLVIKVNRKRNNVVVSRKAILEGENESRKEELLKKLTEGEVLTGRVKNLTSYGAFVDLGGADGLLHVTDLVWGRISHPSEVLKLEQEISVKVLHVEPENGKISLGIKQLSEDPWNDIQGKYAMGGRVQGRVSNITDYGAFVELEQGVEGLIHVSEMTWGKRLRHPSKVVKENDSVETIVLDVNPSQRRISLSLKRVVDDPWATLISRYSEGAIVEGTVRNLTDFGAFVEVEEGVDGLVHLSELSWTHKAKHPSVILEKGQKLRVVVLKVDLEKRRLSLGFKQLQPDVWESFFARVKIGDTLPGKISRKVPFGFFVELDEGIEGLCHNSEIGSGGGENSVNVVEQESRLFFRVLKLNPQEKKIGLSLKEVDQELFAGLAKEQSPIETEDKTTVKTEGMGLARAEQSMESYPALHSQLFPEKPVGVQKPIAKSEIGSIVNISTVASSEKY